MARAQFFQDAMHLFADAGRVREKTLNGYECILWPGLGRFVESGMIGWIGGSRFRLEMGALAAGAEVKAAVR